MGKVRIIVLIVSTMPMLLSFVVYLLLKSERFLKAFPGGKAVDQTEWLPWVLVTVAWFLLSVVISFVFNL